MASPFSLLLKWTTEREPLTIERHQEIADREGSVWRGKFATGTRRAATMAAVELEAMRDQLSGDEPTEIYLLGGGELWAAELLEISDEALDVLPELMPTYYSTSECNLFLRLSGFHELNLDTGLAGLVLRNRPEAGSMAVAVRSRSSLFYVQPRRPVSRRRSRGPTLNTSYRRPTLSSGSRQGTPFAVDPDVVDRGTQASRRASARPPPSFRCTKRYQTRLGSIGFPWFRAPSRHLGGTSDSTEELMFAHPGVALLEVHQAQASLGTAFKTIGKDRQVVGHEAPGRPWEPPGWGSERLGDFDPVSDSRAVT